MKNEEKLTKILLELRKNENDDNYSQILDGLISVFNSSKHLQKNGKIITIAVHTPTSHKLKYLIESVERKYTILKKTTNAKFRKRQFSQQKKIEANTLDMFNDIDQVLDTVAKSINNQRINDYKKAKFIKSFLKLLSITQIQQYLYNREQSKKTNKKNDTTT